MQRIHSQRGAVLILVIGVVAALAILAATLVAVTVNAQSGTSKDRKRAKAVNVAEGSVDAVLAQMSAGWPATSAQTIDTTALASTVRGLFPTGGLDGNPNPPAGGSFDRIYIYDNYDTNGDGKINRLDAPYDSNADGVMIVEVQTNVGGSKAGIVTQVTAAKTPLDIRPNTAIYAGDELTLDGVSTNKSAIGIVSTAPGGTTVDAITTAEFSPNKAYTYGCADNVNAMEDSTLTLDDIIPGPTLDVLQQKCFATKKYPYRYYTSASAATSATQTPVLGGVVVVDPPAGQYATVDLTNNTTSQTSPGILIVTRGNVINIGNDALYYGLIIVRDTPPGSVSFDLGGNASIHGMVFVEGAAKLHGDDKVLYDAAIADLLRNETVMLKARMVPNTWRQVMPQ